MEAINPYESASVQYNDWHGTVAGDDVDMRSFEQLLDIDRDKWRVLLIDITMGGGHQTLVAYGVSAETSYTDLEDIIEDGRTIVLTTLKTYDYQVDGHADTNPPAPPVIPVEKATDFIAYGFKRFHMRLVSRNLPAGAKFDNMDFIDTDGNEG
jgi:hypothetical protein